MVQTSAFKEKEEEAKARLGFVPKIVKKTKESMTENQRTVSRLVANNLSDMLNKSNLPKDSEFKVLMG